MFGTGVEKCIPLIDAFVSIPSTYTARSLLLPSRTVAIQFGCAIGGSRPLCVSACATAGLTDQSVTNGCPGTDQRAVGRAVAVKNRRLKAPFYREMLFRIADHLEELVADGDPRKRKALLRLLIDELRVKSRREILPTYRLITPTVCAMSEKVGGTAHCANHLLIAAERLAIR
jgi:hypothetical protein